MNPGTDLDEKPASVKCFHVDHIREEIFQYLNLPDLLSCRRVSQTLCELTAGTVRQKTKITFHNCLCNRTYDSLKDITKAWNPSKAKWFPCTHFVFTFQKTILNYDFCIQHSFRALEEAFSVSTFGSHVEQLCITWFYDYTILERYWKELNCIQLLEQMLRKTPNLKNFFFDYPVTGKLNIGARNSLRIILAEYCEMVPRSWDLIRNLSNPFLHHLTKLSLGIRGEDSMLQTFLNWAPNLQEACFTPSDFYPAVGFHTHHLVKDVVLKPPNEDFKISEICDRHTPVHENLNDVFRLDSISIDLRQFELKMDLDTKDRIVLGKVVQAFNELLRISWHTIVEIRWNGISTVEEIVWPEVMPKLQSLALRDPFYEKGKQSLFPKEFNWKIRFPQLLVVRLFETKERETGGEEFLKFIQELLEDSVLGLKDLEHSFEDGVLEIWANTCSPKAMYLPT